MTRLLPVAAATIVIALVLDVAAQEPQYRGGTHTVSVYATVADQAGHLATDLTKDDFEVLDDGKPQPISLFSNDIQPITIVVMLDRSGSMEANFGLERKAAETFITKLLPSDLARVGSFSERIEIDPQGFTSDHDELLSALRDHLQSAGPTPLWNATAAAMTALAHQDGRRVVLVFTDGKDNPGRSGVNINVTLDEVLSRSQAEEVMVYAIGLADECERGKDVRKTSPVRFDMQGRGGPTGRGGPPRGPIGPIGPPGFPPIMPPGFPGPMGPLPGDGRIGRPPMHPGDTGDPRTIVRADDTRCGSARPDPGLRSVAEVGGGAYFELHRTDDLSATFARVADELHHQYLLAFPATSLDGRTHTLEVRVKKSDLKVRARRSYQAPTAK